MSELHDQISAVRDSIADDESDEATQVRAHLTAALGVIEANPEREAPSVKSGYDRPPEAVEAEDASLAGEPGVA